MDVMVGCELCGSLLNLQRCSKCKLAVYCCREHQKCHWREHRVSCQQQSIVISSGKRQQHLLLPETSTGLANFDTSGTSSFEENAITDDYLQLMNLETRGVDVPAASVVSSQLKSASSWFDRLNSEHYMSTSDFSNGIGQAAGYSRPHMEGSKKIKLGDPELVPYRHRNMGIAQDDVQQFNRDNFVRTMCKHVINDMDKFGICVIDDFVGKNVGTEILKEVKEMYMTGHFKDGQLMSNSAGSPSTTIRGDKIFWVNGHEHYAFNIGVLIRLVDEIVGISNKMQNNGKMGEYVISDRSKAMIACYPGCGTQYVKHVDNPNKDGRCITSIYYLNENWDVKKDGGLLRIFPTEWTSQVADIEPFFDRVLFFWSDRRNPHEVQPSLRTRYAITLWYNDKSEKLASKQQKLLSHQSSDVSPEI